MIVFAVFILTYITLILVSFVVSSFLVYKKGAVTLGDYVSPSERFVSIVKHRFIKFYTLAYFSAFAFFLIIQSSSYFGNDRAYPKAKAYKIVADVSAFYFDFFIANRDLYYKPSGLKYIEPYEQWQAYLMQKAFTYIPADDAERAIWRYEYYYANYVRARTAPIDFEKLDKNNLKALLQVGGHPTLYKPVAQEMIYEVGELLDMLMDNPMKDKYYDEVNRYVTAILFAGWWEKKKFLYYSLGASNPSKWSKLMNRLNKPWIDDQQYLGYVQKMIVFFDKTKNHSETSKELEEFLKEHRYIYPDLMALRVSVSANLAYTDVLNKKFSCEMDSLATYLSKREEFLEYANSRTYKKLTFKERVGIENFIMGNPHSELKHVLYRSCKINKDKLRYYGDIKMLEDKIYSEDEWKIDRLIVNNNQKAIDE